MYKDGWWAAARLDKAPWDFSPETLKRVAPGVYDPDKDKWELYYLPDDFSQARDLAAEYPDKLRELQDLWWKEAERNRVLPLLGGYSLLMGILPPMPTQTRLEFRPDVQNIQRGMIPRVYGRSYAIEAGLEVPDNGAEGVIVANADFIGGFGHLQAGVRRKGPVRQGHGQDVLRGRRAQARQRRHRHLVGQ